MAALSNGGIDRGARKRGLDLVTKRTEATSLPIAWLVMKRTGSANLPVARLVMKCTVARTFIAQRGAVRSTGVLNPYHR